MACPRRRSVGMTWPCPEEHAHANSGVGMPPCIWTSTRQTRTGRATHRARGQVALEYEVRRNVSWLSSLSGSRGNSSPARIIGPLRARSGKHSIVAKRRAAGQGTCLARRPIAGWHGHAPWFHAVVDVILIPPPVAGSRFPPFVRSALDAGPYTHYSLRIARPHADVRGAAYGKAQIAVV